MSRNEGTATTPVSGPLQPGIHTLSADEYHRDPCRRPSLSASIAHKLCSSSPAHARAAHPKLNPAHARVDDENFDVGTVAHALLLEGIENVEIVYADSWRTKIAKEARDTARENGRTPLLEKHWTAVQEMVAAATEQLAKIDCDPPMFIDGKSEQTLVWEEPGGVFCRARVDFLHDDLSAVDDYKTAHDASPERWGRGSLFNNGCDLQCAFYLRGLERLTGERPTWRWLVQEKTPPYAAVVITPGPDVIAVAEAKVEYALHHWRQCLASGVWPAYATSVVQAELPPWSDDAKWLVPEYRDAA